MKNSSLIKNTRIVSIATLISRFLGFIRDVLIAKFFGTGASAAAFVVAFRLPNLLRNVVGEGSGNAAVVPVLSALAEQNKQEEFRQTANSLLVILLVVSGLLILLGELFAPYIVRAIAPGFAQDPAKLDLTIRLTRLIFPYILLIGLVAHAMAVLNSLKHFSLPALAPCLLNVSLIVAILVISPRMSEPVFGLGIGVLVGGLLQLVIQLPLLIKKGLFSFKKINFSNPGIKKIGRLFLPRTLGVVVYQANVFIDTILASFTHIVGQGAVAALYYGNRIIQLPLALFGIALAQVALPTMSSLVAKKDMQGLKDTLSYCLRNIFTMMIPATIGLLVLARPLVKAIFQRGSFLSYSTEITSLVLLFYCLGLTGYAGIKILANCFYALEDTKTPAKIAGISLLVNVVLNLILMWPMKVAGLALATAISVTLNFILLLGVLKKRIGPIEPLRHSLAKITQAALVMGAVLWFLFYRLSFMLFADVLVVRLISACLVAVLVYFYTLKLIAPREAKILKEWILRKK